MDDVVFTQPGIKVHRPNPENDPFYHQRGDDSGFSRFKGRIPILWDDGARAVYVGAPEWFHHDTYLHHDLDTDKGRFLDEGYFGGGEQWGNGNLKWYGPQPPSGHPEVAQALTEAGYEIPNPEPVPEEDPIDYEDDALWEDEWGDDDHHHVAASKANKFHTTREQHEQSKIKFGLPKPHSTRKVAPFPRPKKGAVDPQWLQQWIDKYGPYMVHSTENVGTRDKILQEGLIPHDHGPGSVYDRDLIPRANHSYIRWMRPQYIVDNAGAGYLDRHVVVDLRKLDPDRINADEDMADKAPNEFAKWGIERPEFNAHVDEQGNRFWLATPSGGKRYRNYGEWADSVPLNSPEHTAVSFNKLNTCAIFGGVSPECLLRPGQAREDYMQNFPHLLDVNHIDAGIPYGQHAASLDNEWSDHVSSVHMADEYVQMPEDERGMYLYGQCAALAAAHQRAYPHLRFGLHYEKLPEDERENLMIEDGWEPDEVPEYRVQHVFTHDDDYAYDANGRHPMPYMDRDKTQFNVSGNEMEGTGMLEYGYMPDDEFVRKYLPVDSTPR